MVKNILDYFKRKNKDRLYKQWVKKGDLSIEEVPLDLLKSKPHQEDGLPEDVTYEQVTEHTTTIDIALDKQQDELLQWALKGFPEETVIQENEKINNVRNELNQRRAELEKRIEVAKQAEVNIQGIKEACELVSKNLEELSFENKRLALEALNIKIWVDGESITIDGAIPMTDCAIASNIW